MSELMNEKVRITVEVEMERYQLEELEISASTPVLGGRIVRFDWEGGLFDEVNKYRELLDCVNDDLMTILFENFDDEDFITELQLAIKRVVSPIIKSQA